MRLIKTPYRYLVTNYKSAAVPFSNMYSTYIRLDSEFNHSINGISYSILVQNFHILS